MYAILDLRRPAPEVFFTHFLFSAPGVSVWGTPGWLIILPEDFADGALPGVPHTCENTAHGAPGARRASARRAPGAQCAVFSYV